MPFQLPPPPQSYDLKGQASRIDDAVKMSLLKHLLTQSTAPDGTVDVQKFYQGGMLNALGGMNPQDRLKYLQAGLPQTKYQTGTGGALTRETLDPLTGTSSADIVRAPQEKLDTKASLAAKAADPSSTPEDRKAAQDALNFLTNQKDEWLPVKADAVGLPVTEKRGNENGYWTKHVVNGKETAERKWMSQGAIPSNLNQMDYGNDWNWNVTGEDFLNSIKNPKDRAIVRGVSQNILSPQDQSVRGALRSVVSTAALQANPEYNRSEFPVIQATNKEYTSGQTGKNIVSLNTAVRHVDQLHDLATALDNGDIQSVNYIKNKAREWTGSSVPTNIESLAPMVGTEIGKMLSGSSVITDQRVAEMERAFESYKSYKQLTDGINEVLKLTSGRAKELESGYKRGKGNIRGFEVVSPDIKNIFKKHGIDYDNVPEGQQTNDAKDLRDLFKQK